MHEVVMKKTLASKLCLSALLALGLCACSTVGPVDIDEEEAADNTSNSSTVKPGSSANPADQSSTSTSSSSAGDSPASSSVSATAEDAKTTEISENPFDSISVARPAEFKTPSLSAVIFWWDTTKVEYEFEAVIDDGFSTYATMESNGIDSLVYEFKWNDEAPEKWERVKISKYSEGNLNSVNFDTEAKKTYNDIKELCLSYASARIIWWGSRDSTGKKDSLYTEWSKPVGPLYTLTTGYQARTTWAKSFTKSPCI